MPVEFFTEEQQRRYGCYTEEPSPLQLARYFHFDDRDHQLIARHQRAHTPTVCPSVAPRNLLLYQSLPLNDHQLKAGGFKSFRRT